MDIKEMNRVIKLATTGQRDECRTDEERELYDRLVRSQQRIKQYGQGLDMIHDID